MTVDPIVILLVVCGLFSLWLGRVLKGMSPSRAILPGSWADRLPSGTDVLRVGSAALVTLNGELSLPEARALGRRCGEMISDGVTNLVVEFDQSARPTDPVLQLLICLADLEGVRGGRVCIVCPDHFVYEQLETAGITQFVPCLTARPEGTPSSGS
jgi:anti-anti-sigma regulatory factor